MTVYIEVDRYGIPKDTNCYSAWDGFQKLGQEVVEFQYTDLVSGKITADREDIFVGDVRSVLHRLNMCSVKPPSMTVPKKLEPFLGRKSREEGLRSARMHASLTIDHPIFIKPVQHKLFNGRVVNGVGDIADLGMLNDDTRIIRQDVVNFTSEWRVYVFGWSKILKVCNYAGDPTQFPHMEQVHSILNNWLEIGDTPIACGIDVGWTDLSIPLLVEINDGWALGNYGLDSVDYAKLLSLRWNELIG